MKKHYVRAVIDLLKSGKDPEAVISGLYKILSARGHERLLPSVLSAVSRELDSESAEEFVLTVARESDIKTMKSVIDKAILSVDEDTEPKITIDPNIIGGFVLANKTKVVDSSYKQQLINLYRNIAK